MFSNSKAKTKEILLEIRLLKLVSTHENIVEFYSASYVHEPNRNSIEYVICTEFCGGKFKLCSAITLLFHS